MLQIGKHLTIETWYQYEINYKEYEETVHKQQITHSYLCSTVERIKSNYGTSKTNCSKVKYTEFWRINFSLSKCAQCSYAYLLSYLLICMFA